MAQTRGHRPWHLGNAPEDPNFAKASNQKDGRSRWEGRDNPRKGKTICWTQELTCETARPWSGRITLDLSAKPQGKDFSDESYGRWTQYVPGLGQRVQVRDRATHQRVAGDETPILWAEAPRADSARGSEQGAKRVLGHPSPDWSPAALHRRRVQPRNLIGARQTKDRV